jgi:hypothetical protein
MVLRWLVPRREDTTGLPPGVFTPEQERRLAALRHQFQACRDSFALEMNFRRLHFARWLVERRILSECAAYGRLAEPDAEAVAPRRQGA